MSDLNERVKDAWVAHIATHSGATPHNDIEGAVHSMGPTAGDGDFARLENYLNVDSTQFKRDVTYQLYYVTECLIWLWKRLPRQILVRDEGRNEVDEQISRLLTDLNAGTLVATLPANLRQNLPNSRQGQRLTPDSGVEQIVKRADSENGEWREAVLAGQSHEPPPPPPVWPAE